MANKKNMVNLNEKNKNNTKQSSKVIKEDVRKEKKIKLVLYILLALLLLAALIFGGIKLFSDNKAEDAKTEEKKEKDPDDDNEGDIKGDNKEEDDDDEQKKEQTLTPVAAKGNNEKEKEESEEESSNVDEDESLIYRLTFDTNGGNEIEDALYEENEKTVAPSIPQRENWIFTGWYKDSDFLEEFVFDSYLTSDITIYAKWSKKIVFQENGDILDEVFVAEDEEIELYDGELTIDDEYIPGWFITIGDEEHEVMEGTLLSDPLFEDTTDTIELNLNPLLTFDLTFMYEDDEILDAPIKAVQGRKIDFSTVDAKIASDYPEITTYGWSYIEAEEYWDFDVNRVAVLTIDTLYLTPNTYTIIYQEISEEDQFDIIDEIDYSADTKVDLLEPEEKENYEFDGWYITEDGVISDDKMVDGDVITSDVTLTGIWNEVSTDSNPIVEDPTGAGENPISDVVEDNPEESEENQNAEEEELADNPDSLEEVVETPLEETLQDSE